MSSCLPWQSIYHHNTIISYKSLASPSTRQHLVLKFQFDPREDKPFDNAVVYLIRSYEATTSKVSAGLRLRTNSTDANTILNSENITAVSMKRSLVDVNADTETQRKRQVARSSVSYGPAPGAIQDGNIKVQKLNDQCLIKFQNACKEALERDASADLGPLFEEHGSRYARLRRVRENQADQGAQGL